jgi:hypothetical protein
VPGIVAALKAHDRRRLLGQQIDDLALALVTPLGADDDDETPGTHQQSARAGVRIAHVFEEVAVR